jgi:hypothetical protein
MKILVAALFDIDSRPFVKISNFERRPACQCLLLIR